MPTDIGSQLTDIVKAVVALVNNGVDLRVGYRPDRVSYFIYGSFDDTLKVSQSPKRYVYGDSFDTAEELLAILEKGQSEVTRIRAEKATELT